VHNNGNRYNFGFLLGVMIIFGGGGGEPRPPQMARWATEENAMTISTVNRRAWDREVERANPFTIPVSAETVAAARRGEWEIRLTETKPVPRDWFPALAGCEVLCLAGGGGQQGPILAAAGARVTVFDLSPRQLAQDRRVAERDGLDLHPVAGDMADLSVFAGRRFDLIVHPVANLFVPDVHPVWAEAYRVLRRGGVLLAAFVNPAQYIFDLHRMDTEGALEVKHPLPFSSLDDLSAAERARYFGDGAPLEFSHTLEDQIGGQLRAGFVLTGFYADHRGDSPLAPYIPSSFATRALKP
jgi:SAM-dependent methyltransferase